VTHAPAANDSIHLLTGRGRGTVTTTISGAIPATAALTSDSFAACRATASSDAIRRATRDASSGSSSPST
jgi:hypothetical protein